MKIAIIGAGNVGGALATKLIQANHQVLIGAKFPLSVKAIQLATKIGEDRFASIENACKQSDIIIISTPADAIISILEQCGHLQNKIVIDTTNAIRVKPEPYATAFDAIKELANVDKLVKCFNSTGFENILDPIYHGAGIDMFYAGNNEEANQVAIQLAIDIGFANCYNFGGADKVALLEMFALSWINLAIMQGHGRNIAFKIIKR